MLISMHFSYKSEINENKKSVKEIIQHLAQFPIDYANSFEKMKDNPHLRDSMLKNYYFLATLGHDLMAKHPNSFNPIEHIIMLESLSMLSIYDESFVNLCDRIKKSKIPFACSYANRILGNYYYHINKTGLGSKHFSDALNTWEHHRDYYDMGKCQKISTYVTWAMAEMNRDNEVAARRHLRKAQTLVNELNDFSKAGYPRHLSKFEGMIDTHFNNTKLEQKENPNSNSTLTSEQINYYKDLLSTQISIQKLADQAATFLKAPTMESPPTNEEENSINNAQPTTEGDVNDSSPVEQNRAGKSQNRPNLQLN